VVLVDLDDLTAHAVGDLAQFALLIDRGLIQGGDSKVDNRSTHGSTPPIWEEQGAICRITNQPIFDTENSDSKMARFLRFLAVHFEGFFSYSWSAGRRHAWGEAGRNAWGEAGRKCEGRKSYAERDPALVFAAKRLHRRSPKGHRRSLRDIARKLQTMGYSNKQGQPYSASCIKSMVEGPCADARGTRARRTLARDDSK
jgi:hypothetical protein